MSKCEQCGHEKRCPRCSGRCGGKAKVKKGFGKVKLRKDIVPPMVDAEWEKCRSVLNALVDSANENH